MQSTAPLLTGWNLLFIVPLALGAVLALLSVLAAWGGHGGHGHGGHTHSGCAIHHGHHGHGTLGHPGHGHRGGHPTSHTGITAGHSPHGLHHRVHHTEAIRHASGGSERADATERMTQPRGAVPPLIVVQNFLLFGGLCGLVANLLYGVTPHELPMPSILVALLGGIVLTALASALLVRLLPAGTSSVATAYDLEGRVGEADTAITTTGGSAYVRDWNGTLHHVACRLRAQDGGRGDNEEPVLSNDRLPGGTPVLLIEFNVNGSYYEVRRWNQEEQ